MHQTPRNPVPGLLRESRGPPRAPRGSPLSAPALPEGPAADAPCRGFTKAFLSALRRSGREIFLLIALAEDPLVELRAGEGSGGPHPQDGVAPLPGHEARRGSSSWLSKRLRLLGEKLVASSASSSSSSAACFPSVCGYRHKLEPL